MLLFIALGAGLPALQLAITRLKDDNVALMQYIGLIVLLSLLVLMCSPAHRLSV